MENFEEGQIVLCTVENIAGTIIFVKIKGGGEGTITTSEISPGRIRNLRDYVVPGKKIVCKILRIKGNQINLSLRRVKLNEKKEFLEKEKREKNSEALLKTVLKEKSEEIIEKIKQEHDLIEFMESSKENPKLLEKYISKSDAEKIIEILKSKKTREIEIKKTFKLSNKNSDGILIIKKILIDSCTGTTCEISYLAAGKYSLKIKDKDGRIAKTHIQKTIENIEAQAKENKCEFEEIKVKVK